MPDYDFKGLSPVDFEHLTRDILNADLGLRLHSYTIGRDQGIDLRQVDAEETIVVQCKHYARSSHSDLMTTVKKEARRGGSLAVSRYIFVTSRPLTPQRQGEIHVALKERLPIALDDIWGSDELNAALSRHPEVERRHVKLWIPSAGVIQTLIHSGRWQRSEALLEDLANRARLWVHTAAYDQVISMLDTAGVCIVSGPPGVGKTFLAEMVLLAAVGGGWEVVHVGDDIEEAWKALLPDPGSRQIFYYDDFLGQAGLELASKNEPTSLLKFLDRVRQQKNSKRVILTTREQIMNEAAEGADDRLSRLADFPARVRVYLDGYDQRTRTEILFNHLYFSQLPDAERTRLAIDNRLIGIVEHPSYNPRIIETGIRMAGQPTAEAAIETLGRALADPREVWQGSFRSLSNLEQGVLLTLATLPHRPWPVEELRSLVKPDSSLAWTPALRMLDGTWLRISEQASAPYLGFASPACRDYLLGILDDYGVASDQLDRVALMGQLLSLAQSAGLLTTGTRGSRGERAGLARALTSRRDHISSLVKRLTETALGKSGSLMADRWKAFNDAAVLLGRFGAAGETGWLLDYVQSAVNADPAQSPRPGVVMGFDLAENVSNLPVADADKRDSLVAAITEAAIAEISTLRDLDVYEAAPERLKTGELVILAHVRASIAIDAEFNYLITACDEPDELRTGALDLEERACWFGTNIDIGPLLDRVGELEAARVDGQDRPDSRDEPRGQAAENPWDGPSPTLARLAEERPVSE